MFTAIIFIVLLQEVLGGFHRDINIITAKYKSNNNLAQISPISDAIGYSVEIALENCQKQFQWDKWNCPTKDFLLKRSASVLDRETAFVQAITTASLVYTVTKNCSRGELVGCGCDLKKVNEDEFIWSGCSDHVDQAEIIAEHFLEKKPKKRSLDIYGLAELHNSRAGRIAVRNSLRKHCRCHGLSGSCSLQTCWLSLNAFPEIANDIRKKFNNAVKLTVDNYGDFNLNSINEESMVYMLDSPDYCKMNVIPGWMGTRGRQCSRSKGDDITSHERKSCKNLCRSCGLKVRKEQKVRKRRCNCKFNWCCDVQCDICTDVVDAFFCES